MTSFEDIREPLTKVLEVIHKGKIARFTGKGNPITAERLERAVCNHMCDDHPELFNITENEGHLIRSYFQENGFSYGWREYLLRLHQEFPHIMDKEDPTYIRETNEQRKKDGLCPILL